MTEKIILKAESISKSSSDAEVLQNVSFELKKGEILSVIGGNGADKSTLMKTVTGAFKNDRGEAYFGGEKLSLNSPSDTTKTGISVVYQEPNIFTDMSVLENVFMGSKVINSNRTIQWIKMHEEAMEAPKLVGLSDSILYLTIGELPTGSRQLVLITRGIYKEYKILILNGPISILSYGESGKLFEIVADLKPKGVSAVYISHRIPKILWISDNTIVLRDGCLTGTLSSGGVDEESIIIAISGCKVNMSVYQTREVKGDTMLEIRNLEYKSQYQNITFSLKPGEVLGMYGLVGSSRSEIARVTFGETKAETGNIVFKGKDTTRTDINGTAEKNIFYVPEDRGTQGLFNAHPIRDNMSVPFLDSFSNKFSFIRRKEEGKTAQDNIEKYSIEASSQNLNVNSLSGGSQQKVLLCRWLMRKPKVLVLDEPTRRVDVTTKAEIHKYIMEPATGGMAILVVSSDLPEIVEVSDRILTLHKGAIATEFDRETVAEERILKDALNLSNRSLNVHSEEVQ